MKNLISTPAIKICAGVTVCLAMASLSGCKKNDNAPDLPTNHQSFTVVNLVASDATMTAARTDAHLLNGWGIAFSPTGTAWVSSPGDHTTLIYNSTGGQVLAPVTIPSHTAATGGIPTGQVFNSSTGFKLSNGNPAKFIFAGVDGVISGWNGGAAALPMVDRNGTSVYTGITIAVSGTDTLLYAADFSSRKIDVFNKSMTLQTVTFTDPVMPAEYSPFNIQSVGNLLYVTYAQPDPVTHTEKKGAGLGIVDVFNTNGTFVKRLVTGGALNAPWAVAQAPDNWLTGTTGTILIGNLGDGHINAYNSSSGTYLGALQSNGSVIAVDGLWALSFAPSAATNINPNWLYFAAGPGGETKGLFGYITNGN
jgi:uncharacterized protein (TIGR03118 family)